MTSAAARLPCVVVCTYNVARLPAGFLDKGGMECHPLTCRHDQLGPNERFVPPERFLEALTAGPE